MPNHIHLLISEPKRATIANVIQSLKIASAKRATSREHRPDSATSHDCRAEHLKIVGCDLYTRYQRIRDAGDRDSEKILAQARFEGNSREQDRGCLPGLTFQVVAFLAHQLGHHRLRVVRLPLFCQTRQ